MISDVSTKTIKQDAGKIIKSKEFQELFRSTVMLGFTGLTTYATYARLQNKKDRTFLETLAFTAARESFTLIGALDPSLFLGEPRVGAFLKNFSTSLVTIIKSLALEDEVKGTKQFIGIFTPALLKHVMTSAESSLNGEIDKTYKNISKMIVDGDRESAAHALVDLKTNWPDVYEKVSKMIKDDLKGITESDKLMRTMGVANGERARYIFSEMQNFKTSKEKLAYVDELTKKNIATKVVRKQIAELIQSGGKDGNKPTYKDTTVTSGYDIISTTVLYAKAVGTDPLTAFNRIFTGQRIRRIDNGAIIVERMSLADSTKVKQKLGSTGDMRLEHVVSLELGGSNSSSNLRLVTKEEWDRFTIMDNYLGKKLREGLVSKDEAQDLVIRYKQGEIDEAYIYDIVEK
jgi:hypothetical protein